MTDAPSDASIIAERQKASFARASDATTESLPPERRLDEAEIGRLLDRRKYLTIASTRSDGRPHAVMNAFLWYDGRFWLPAVAGAARVSNVRRTPFASLVVAEGEGDDHFVLVVNGPTGEVSSVDAAVERAWAAKFEWEPTWAATWIVVEPEVVFTYGPSPEENA